MISIGFDGVQSAPVKLAPWRIHDVEFKGVEYSKFKGVKDPNAEYEVMKVKFANKEGFFEETVFCPKDGDEIRPKTGDKENPSALERFLYFINQLGERMAPERYAKFKGRKYKFPKEFELMVRDLGETLKPAVGKTFKLKLIGNKKNEPVLPYFVNIDRNGQAYSRNNFIGVDNVFFTHYELESMEKRKNATPTPMEGKTGDGLDNVAEAVAAPAVETEDESENSEGINFDV